MPTMYSTRPFRTAITLGLKNQDGRARGSISGIYQRLSLDDIKPLLPAIQPRPIIELRAQRVARFQCHIMAGKGAAAAAMFSGVA